MAGHGNKAIIAALFANAGIAIAKFAGFLVTGASSLLAESIHRWPTPATRPCSCSAAARPSGWPPRPTRGRERHFWSFVVSMVLFSLGSLFAIYEGIEKLRHPQWPAPTPDAKKERSGGKRSFF